MRLPVLLDGHTMNQKAPLYPAALSLSLKADSLDSANIVLDPEDNNVEIAVGDWVQIPVPHGADFVVMYVLTKELNPVNGMITLQLQHTFGLLGDITIFGETKTSDIVAGASSVTVTQVITWLLNKQDSTNHWWTIGTIDPEISEPWRFSSTDVLSALNDVLTSIEDVSFEFDQSVFPWRLNLKNWPAEVTGEMRLGRNISTMRMNVDRSKMYTRAYPIGKNNANIKSVNDTAYLQRNTATYGVISQIIQEPSIDDPGLLKLWAKRQLKRNADPAVTVTINGFDLSESTGVSLDRFLIGQKIRIPLPEFGTTVTDRIVELTYPDLIHDDRVVNISLANERKTIHGVINDANHGGGGGGGPRKTDIESAQWTEEITTDFKVSKTNITGLIVGVGYKLNPDGSIATDEHGYPIRNPDDPNEDSIFSLRDQDNNHFEQTIGGVTNRVTNVEGKVTTIEGSTIWQKKDNIVNFVGEWDVYIDPQTGLKTIRLKSGGGMKILRNNVEYGLYDSGNLSAGVIVEKINGDQSQRAALGFFDEGTLTAGFMIDKINNETTAHIQAENIYIGNDKSTTVINGKLNASDVTADYLGAKLATLPTLHGIVANFTGNITSGGALTGVGVYVGTPGSAQNLATGVKSIVNVGSGNTVTLRITHFDSTTDDITFNRAATPRLMGSWSNGTVTVSSTPTAEANYVASIKQGAAIWDGEKVSLPILFDTNQLSDQQTGRTVYVNVEDYLVSHSNATYGLSRYSIPQVGYFGHLYYKMGSSYYDAGQHDWYYKDQSSALVTMYTLKEASS